jgi:hypothetical protein
MINTQGQQLTTKVTLRILVLLTLLRMSYNTLELYTLGIVTVDIATVHRMHERIQIHFQMGFGRLLSLLSGLGRIRRFARLLRGILLARITLTRQ